jgi:hypothetical protein
MDFRPMSDLERQKLINALRNNAEQGEPIMMNGRTTTFEPTLDEVTDDEVIAAIKSVPCHYSRT